MNETECRWISVELLEAFAKYFYEVFQELLERMKLFWSNIKECAKEWQDSLPESSKLRAIKPFPPIKYTVGKRMKCFHLLRKPRAIRARTNC